MEKAFNLVPAQIPSRRGRGAAVYSSILTEFMKSSEKSVRVEIPNRKPLTVSIGLRQAVKADNVEVTVVQRGAEVYLQKK